MDIVLQLAGPFIMVLILTLLNYIANIGHDYKFYGWAIAAWIIFIVGSLFYTISYIHHGG